MTLFILINCIYFKFVISWRDVTRVKV